MVGGLEWNGAITSVFSFYGKKKKKRRVYTEEYSNAMQMVVQFMY